MNHLKYSLIDRSDYSKVSKYLDDAHYCVEVFNPVTETEFDLAYDVMEEKYAKMGILCDQGDFNSEADFCNGSPFHPSVSKIVCLQQVISACGRSMCARYL
jgi:hypothetical protein